MESVTRPNIIYYGERNAVNYLGSQGHIPGLNYLMIVSVVSDLNCLATSDGKVRFGPVLCHFWLNR
jgi:hypothetical protein